MTPDKCSDWQQVGTVCQHGCKGDLNFRVVDCFLCELAEGVAQARSHSDATRNLHNKMAKAGQYAQMRIGNGSKPDSVQDNRCAIIKETLSFHDDRESCQRPYP